MVPPTEPVALYKHIERAARTCYRSHNRADLQSHERLIRMLIARGHESMLEHSNIVLEMTPSDFYDVVDAVKLERHYLRFSEDYGVVSGNVRAFRDVIRRHPRIPFASELNRLYPLLFEDLECKGVGMCRVIIDVKDYFADDPEEYAKHAAVSVFFHDVDRGFTHEIVRMRSASFAQESTRWVDYAKKGVDFLYPDDLPPFLHNIYKEVYKKAEFYYGVLRGLGVPPEMARSILPIGVMTNIVVTTTVEDWRRIIALRTAKDAHPTMRKVLESLKGII